jgi:acetolactate decarboxylase
LSRRFAGILRSVIEVMVLAVLDARSQEALVNEVIGNPNMFAAVRFTGQFEKVDTRTVFCQCRPYLPMLDVVRKQPTRHFGASSGTMPGFRSPAYRQGVNAAGYHLHFLSADQTKGGPKSIPESEPAGRSRGPLAAPREIERPAHRE